MTTLLGDVDEGVLNSQSVCDIGERNSHDVFMEQVNKLKSDHMNIYY